MFPVSLSSSSFLGLMYWREDAKTDKHSNVMGLLLHVRKRLKQFVNYKCMSLS